MKYCFCETYSTNIPIVPKLMILIKKQFIVSCRFDVIVYVRQKHDLPSLEKVDAIKIA